MAAILPFRIHARTSTRAAKAVSISADSPDVADRSVASIADHHSAGILSRCHHLETAGAPAPRSAAMASREGHSSMMDRNEVKSVMPNALRQLVLKGKDNLSADVGIIQRHNVLMSRPQPDSQFKALFLARTALAREKAGYTQESMAEALGMDQSKYSKYEVRTELPHHLIIPFCSLCDVSPAWLFTAVVEAREPKPRRRRRSQRAKAA